MNASIKNEDSEDSLLADLAPPGEEELGRFALDSNSNHLRLYLMKYTKMQQNYPKELSSCEVRKLLVSPPQSPSINSTSREVSVSTSESVIAFEGPDDDQQLDSTNDSDALVMAVEEESMSEIRATTLKTLQSPLNDGIYTYWAVVKTTTAPTATSALAVGGATATGTSNYYGKIKLVNRYVDFVFCVIFVGKQFENRVSSAP